MEEINLIPFGKKNRISKIELMRKFELPEEAVNKKISELRRKYLIFSDTKIGGYWRPNSEQELLEFIREHNSRIFLENGLIQMAWNEIDKIKGGCK